MRTYLGGTEMKYFFDTEFIEDGKTIDLISIGVVSEDGREYYAEASECDFSKASEWVKENVFPTLTGTVTFRNDIARGLIQFCGNDPEFWAYFASYDWVVLCQLFGTMMDLPRSWPMAVMDIRQEAKRLNLPKFPKQEGGNHNALADARWARDMYERYLK